MLKHGLFLLFLLALSLPANAQNLIPFPGSNGRYGFVNEAGQPVTAPQFKRAWLPNEQGITLALDEKDSLRIIRQDGVVLPGAIAWQWLGYDPQVFHAQNGRDTVPGIWCVRGGYNQDFLLVRKGSAGWETRKYLYYDRLKSPVSIYGNYRPENYSSFFEWYNGYCRVIKSERRVNFVNTRLEEVFKTDFENGAVLLNGHFALVSPDGQFALGDERGRILTPFQFRNIIGTPRKGHFVVNYTPGQASAHVGLLRADGAFAIDTVYSELKAATDQVLVAGSGAFYGLLNYAGDTILPFEYTYLEYTRDDYFIASREFQGKIIINSRGETLWEKPQEHIRFYSNYSEDKRLDYFQLEEDYAFSFITLLDSSLHLIYADTLRGVERRGDYFKVTAKGGKRQGVIRNDGSLLVPVQYLHIERFPANQGFLVKNDTLSGLYTKEGVEALPCRYRRLVFQQAGDSIIIWANPYSDKNLYTAFNPKGNRLPIPEQIAPTLAALEMQNCFFPEMENGRWKLTLPDGSFIFKPREYPYNNRNIGTPDGCVMVECADGRCDVLNAYFKSILPTGFYIPEKRYRGPYIKNGLIPVTNSQNQWGILNTKGKWVQKPGNLQYHILRPDLYSEHKGEPRPEDMNGMTICKITQEGIQRTEVHFMDDKFSDEGYLVIGRLFDDAPEEIRQKYWYGGKVMKYALMDTFGRVITPFILQKFPERIRGFWTAKVYEPDYQIKTVLFDSLGKILADYGQEPIEYYDPERHWLYFTTKEHFTGIRDTLGREILPAKYRRLNWNIPGRLFNHELSEQERQLCDAKGNVVLSGFQYVNLAKDISDGFCYVVTLSKDGGYTCHVLSPDNRVLCALPGRDVERVERFPDLLKVEMENREVRYVDYKRGLAFGQ